MSVTYLAKVEVAEDDISFASSSSNFDMIKKPSSSAYLLIYGGMKAAAMACDEE